MLERGIEVSRETIHQWTRRFPPVPPRCVRAARGRATSDVDRTGVQWRYLPHDFPHWNTVYGYFARWQQEGVFAQLNGLLRQLLRQKEGREAEPSACVIDAQSVKTSTRVLASGGIDAGKKIVGRYLEPADLVGA